MTIRNLPLIVSPRRLLTLSMSFTRAACAAEYLDVQWPAKWSVYCHSRTVCNYVQPFSSGLSASRKFSQQRTLPANCLPLCAATQPHSWCFVKYSKKAKKEKVVKGSKKKVELSAEELEGVLDLPNMQDDMHEAVEHLKQQLIHNVNVRTNIGAYHNLKVKTEDGVFPLVQLGQVVQKNPSLILVNLVAAPQCIPAVKEALAQSGLNVEAQQEGTTLYIPVPKVTREHREQLAKNAKMLHDKAKMQLRDIHNKYVKKIRAAKDHHAEDVLKAAQDLVLEEMHSYGEQIDNMLTAKQEELLGGK